MSVENSLAYQQKFFGEFAKAWQDHSYYRLYAGIDKTAETLRLDIHEVPGYILAYDKSAQKELRHFLQSNLVDWLREYVPFFEVSDDGHVYFGDWYHRREFGSLDVFARSIVHQSESQQAILPHLSQFAQDPDHYLDDQIEHLRKEVYQRATDLHARLENLETSEDEPEELQQRSSSNSGSGFRGLLKNFIDPDDAPSSSNSSNGDAPKKRPLSNTNEISQVRTQFEDAKDDADQRFDAEKRQLQVDAAVTRYEYQAVMNRYSSIDQFINILTNLRKDYMKALKAAEEERQNA
ncbi:SbcC family exonuclease [Lacticaseibacillus pabuli]|uniref:SbcC family exonuclease n=1 Tax=Lacticaseibacillus pabuli TaxID=3025672 RepID=A0ABY7WS64_9LACO|nr:SbcC family exonuclease [Lacticaseibacillus sp. KACC 23028]WDF83023.1 SbcC family exonuclease [Lacticaseibacillus sp. KACC 23028]